VELTIDALGERVRAALEGADEPQGGRIRAIPDVRTIRYYTTLGLLDRPAEMRGRTAIYGEKHVLQLVAIKRLQAEGKTLEVIQAELAGATQKKLAKIARIDLDATPAAPVSARAESFWRDAPSADETPPAPRTLQPHALALAPGVMLVVERAPPIDERDRRRLIELAAPLLEALNTLGNAEDQEG